MSIYEINVSDPLQHYADRANELDEIYEVVRTIVLAGRNWKYYRFEVVKRYLASGTSPTYYYTVLAYVEDVLEVERLYQEEQSVTGKTRIWTRWASFPGVRADSADDALQQALHHLVQRVN